MASAVDARPARPAGAPLNAPADLLVLVLLAIPAALIGWQIASVWSWPVTWRVAWAAGGLALLGGLFFVSLSWDIFVNRCLGIGTYLWLGSMALVTAPGACRAYFGSGPASDLKPEP